MRCSSLGDSVDRVPLSIMCTTESAVSQAVSALLSFLCYAILYYLRHMSFHAKIKLASLSLSCTLYHS